MSSARSLGFVGRMLSAPSYIRSRTWGGRGYHPLVTARFSALAARTIDSRCPIIADGCYDNNIDFVGVLSLRSASRPIRSPTTLERSADASYFENVLFVISTGTSVIFHPIKY